MHLAISLRTLRPKSLALLMASLAALTIPLMSFPEMAGAICGTNCTYSDPWGTQEVAGAGWMGGNGVSIYSNGPLAPTGPSPDTYNHINNSNNVSTTTGIEWQCVELVNRLYISKGWITNTWSGNG